MDWRLAKRLELEFISLPKPLEAHALDGRLLCRVTHCTCPIQFTISKDHTEVLSFYLPNSPSHPLILGFPWLSKHNPHINWSTGRVLGWDRCSVTCASLVPTSEGYHTSDVSSPISLGLTAVPRSSSTSSQPASLDSDFPDFSRVPPCYLDLKEVFNKTRASALPPHNLMTVPFVCYQGLHPLGGACIPCLHQR